MMTQLAFYNTLTRRKEDFTPIDKNNVRLYVCGPTVYDYAHIGNARPVIVFDVLYRLLRTVYGVNHVRYVRNITDVDDKINARAARDYPNLPLNDAIAKVTAKTEKQFQADVAALNCLKPNEQPRATRYIGKMREMIERLAQNGHAYVTENHVLFSVPAMNKTAGKNGNPLYGQLSRRTAEELRAGARVGVERYKRDPQDFVLWKPSQAGEPGWPSPAGIAVLGRPGWHIECSAMSMGELLEPFGGGIGCDNPGKNVFDIHGGGHDLIFPHHENEIAQSCCAFGGARMADFWLHNGFVQVEGQKMSKSLGNFTTIRAVLETDLPEFNEFVAKEDKIRWAGLAARFAMLQTHYRKPLDWTQERLAASSAELCRWYELLRASSEITAWWQLGAGAATIKKLKDNEVAAAELLAALADDVNTAQAIALLRGFYARREIGKLLYGMRLLGLIDTAFLTEDCLLFIRSVAMPEAEIAAAIAKRTAFIAAKNWAAADKIRDELLQKGIKLQDSIDKNTGKRIVRWEVA